MRGGDAVEMDVWRTRHGPVVHGDPRQGTVIALRYSSTDRPARGFETLRPMLGADTVVAGLGMCKPLLLKWAS